MAVKLNTILAEAGLDASGVRLLRHKDNRASKGRIPYELWRDSPAQFDSYQSTQSFQNRLVFAADGLRVAGSDGCNRLSGSFEQDGDRLRFGRMASTRMSCPDDLDQQQRFRRVLEQVERHRIRGSHLELLAATGAVSARFEAVALE